jgi:hypothetical protein
MALPSMTPFPTMATMKKVGPCLKGTLNVKFEIYMGQTTIFRGIG